MKEINSIFADDKRTLEGKLVYSQTIMLSDRGGIQVHGSYMY